MKPDGGPRDASEGGDRPASRASVRASAGGRVARGGLLGVAAALLLLHVRLFSAGGSVAGTPKGAAALARAAIRTPATFITDDAYISFVYARNLAEHGQLVFNVGEPPVEGYTNFLWTVLLAGLLKLGLLPERVAVPLGEACAVGTMLVCAFLLARLRRLGRAATGAEDASPWDATPALLLAAAPGYACWASGGLETQLFTFLVTLAIALYLVPARRASDRRGGAPDEREEPGAPEPLRLSAGLCFGLAALTRPEGIFFFALTMLHRSVVVLRARRPLRPTRDELRFALAFLALVVPHLLFRRAYYGYWLPNTFYIKASGGAGRATWGRGLYYLRRFAEAHALAAFALAPVASLYRPRDRGTNRLFGYALLVVPAFLVYVASVGGDFMGLFRFALPILPLLFAAATLGLRALVGEVLHRSILHRSIAPALVALLFGLDLAHAAAVDEQALAIGSDRGIDTPGYLKYYTDDRAAIGRFFGRHREPDDYAAVGGAGAQVYFSRIPSLDCFGLSDAHIAHDVPPVDTRPGHQKYAPVDYQLARRPTIITSNYYAIGNAFAPRPDAPFWREHGYRYVSAEVPGLSAPVYTFLLRDDRALGPIPAATAKAGKDAP